MVVKIYGAIISTCCQRVVTVCKELNIPYEIVPINFDKGEHKSPEYLEKQPFGQVPYMIDDDGFTLYESRAIARYLAEKYAPGKLTPTEPKGAGRFNQAASVEVSNFDPSAASIVFEIVFKPMWKLTADQGVVAEKTKALEGKLAVYEVILSKQKYVAGNELTAVDLFHLPYGHLVSSCGVNLADPSRPNVKRWWEEVSSRPSWQEVQKEVKEEMAKAH